MRKPYLRLSALFFVLSFGILYLSPLFAERLHYILNNADLLLPFSLYQSVLDPLSKPDWVLGGNTPFLEVLLGFFLWLPSRSIPLTVALFALLQPLILTGCLMFLAVSIAGPNPKLYALVLTVSALNVIGFALGLLPFQWFLYGWYLHISTICLTLLALGFTVQFLFSGSLRSRRAVTALAMLFLACALGMLSDALFLSQFVAPSLALVIALWIVKAAPLRKAAYAGLSILYGTAAGLALFNFPAWLGAERIALAGSYFKPSLQLALDNRARVAQILTGVWSGQFWLAAGWLLFYLLCLLLVWRLAHQGLRENAGRARPRLLAVLLFFPIQLAATLGANLLTLDPALRYVLPVVILPLFWGWPLLAAARPVWMRVPARKLSLAAGALAIVAAAVAFAGILAGDRPFNALDFYPDYIRCIDENAGQFGLRNGVAQYWLARPITLLSKTGLRVVQVQPDLAPFEILNNSDGYDQPFDFAIIDAYSPNGDPNNAHWIRKELIVERFGQPASSFFCDGHEILIYNRPGDAAFRRQFQGFIRPVE